MRSRRVKSFKSKECTQGRFGFSRASLEQGMGEMLRSVFMLSCRAQGTLLNNKGSSLKALECALALLALTGSLCNRNLSKSEG